MFSARYRIASMAIIALTAGLAAWGVLYSATGRPVLAHPPTTHRTSTVNGRVTPLGQPYIRTAVPVSLAAAQAATPVLLPDTSDASTAGLGQVYMATHAYTDAPDAPITHTVELWYPSSGIQILEYPLLPPDSAATWLAGEKDISVATSVGAPSFVTIDGTTAAVVDPSTSAIPGEAFVGLVLNANLVVEITGKSPTTLGQLEAVAASM